MWNFVRACDIFQRHKIETLKPSDLVQPLPTQVWVDISFDFIERVLTSQEKDILSVAIHRFSKYGHFVALPYPYTIITVARSFFDNIFKLHGLLETMVSDQDVTFTNLFWKKLFR